jgi:hypothetical protein
VKELYELTDVRTQAYNPSEPLKPGEGFRHDGNVGQLDLSRVDPSSGATLAAGLYKLNPVYPERLKAPGFNP